MLEQGAAGELPVLVEYSANCTIYLSAYGVLMSLNGTGTAAADLSGVVELVFPPHCSSTSNAPPVLT